MCLKVRVCLVLHFVSLKRCYPVRREHSPVRLPGCPSYRVDSLVALGHAGVLPWPVAWANGGLSLHGLMRVKLLSSKTKKNVSKISG
jgi:hypothetical protein